MVLGSRILCLLARGTKQQTSSLCVQMGRKDCKTRQTGHLLYDVKSCVLPFSVCSPLTVSKPSSCGESCGLKTVDIGGISENTEESMSLLTFTAQPG